MNYLISRENANIEDVVDGTDGACAQIKPLLAYRVEIEGSHCICFAASAAKARWIAVKSYWEAGYGRKGVWPRPTAARCPIYDNHSLKKQPNRAYSEDYL